jgi:predicted thioesterase
MDFAKTLGAVGMATMNIRPGDTSVAHGTNDLSTSSVSALIGLVESAVTASLIDLLSVAETTQTAAVEFELITALAVGEPAIANARCIAIESDLLTFEAEVVNSREKTIATAVVQRRLVDRITYMARIAAERLAN